MKQLADLRIILVLHPGGGESLFKILNRCNGPKDWWRQTWSYLCCELDFSELQGDKHRCRYLLFLFRLPKQATVTRRRVLRRVVTKAGQEIVIHEAPTPEVSDSEFAAKKIPPPQRPGSPNPKPANKRKAKGFDFEMTSTESSLTSGRGYTSQNSDDQNLSIDNVVSQHGGWCVMTDVYQAISPSEEKSEFQFTIQEDHQELPKENCHKTRIPYPVRTHKALWAPVGAMLSKRENKLDNADNCQHSSKFFVVCFLLK